MQRLLAIIGLTWKAAFRYRLFWVLSVLMIGSVILIPLLIKHDGTARGFTQILLTYTLGTIVCLLGLATLWLACGTLARDIEECQMQMVAVKPIPRWQIWMGKWLGIITLDAALLALSGLCVYGLLEWRSGRLPAEQQAILRNEVLVARGSMKEPELDIQPDVERIFKERMKTSNLSAEDKKDVRKQIEEQVKAQQQLVPPGFMRQWNFDTTPIRAAVAGRPLYLRVKFYSATTNYSSATYLGSWRLGSPTSPRMQDINKSMASDTFHEFTIPWEAVNPDGKLIINFINKNPVYLLFPLEDGMEVLYREGGFGLNFFRGMIILLCWLSLLAAVGLAASSFLSFPVAAFVSLSLMAIIVGSGTISSVVEEGTVMGRDHDTGQPENPGVDVILLPAFKGLLKVINLAEAFSPVDALSTGRSIPWPQVGKAFFQIVLLLSGTLALFGIVGFTRRELATVQGSS